MSEPEPRTYTLHGAEECDRLELQATMAPIEDHLRYLPIPVGGYVLDAGCGSGSMARLLARRHSASTVIGLDLNAGYVAYARELAARGGLPNVSFEEGDVTALPFADAMFDVVWSKHVLFFVSEPDRAVSEICRVTKPGGLIVFAMEDWSNIVLAPEPMDLQKRLFRVLDGLADITITHRLPLMLMTLGLRDTKVEVESSKVYTAIGSYDENQRKSHGIEMHAARSHIEKALGGVTECDRFLADWFKFLDNPDTYKILPLWFIQSRVSVAPAH